MRRVRAKLETDQVGRFGSESQRRGLSATDPEQIRFQARRLRQKDERTVLTDQQVGLGEQTDGAARTQSRKKHFA